MKYAIIGLGGMGKGHFANTEELKKRMPDLELVALCDADISRLRANIATNMGAVDVAKDISKFNIYTDAEELLDKEKLDFIISAVPTHIHEKIALMAMQKGVHVFSEKPMARTLEQAENMLVNARKYNVKLMIGHCQRYDGPFRAIKEVMDSKRYGKLIKLYIGKKSPAVLWSWNNWLMDHEKSGGAQLDMHVHDVDFVSYLLGTPKSVTSFASNYACKQEAIATHFEYDDLLVTSEADWSLPTSFPFTEEYTARFEKATLVFGLDGVKIYTEEGAKDYEVTPSMCYVDEIIDFVHCILEDTESEINPPEASYESLRIALAEKMSADLGETVKL